MTSIKRHNRYTTWLDHLAFNWSSHVCTFGDPLSQGSTRPLCQTVNLLDCQFTIALPACQFTSSSLYQPASYQPASLPVHHFTSPSLYQPASLPAHHFTSPSLYQPATLSACQFTSRSLYQPASLPDHQSSLFQPVITTSLSVYHTTLSDHHYHCTNLSIYHSTLSDHHYHSNSL